jgi:hypothetical protein
VRFLIDECLSVELVTVAGDHEAQHVAHTAMANHASMRTAQLTTAGGTS